MNRIASSWKRTQHLTDTEFSSLLDGAEPGASVEAHLAQCACCREELAIVQDSLGSFRALSTTWAEATAPQHLPVPAGWLHRRSRQATWCGGLAAATVAGVMAFWLGFSGMAHRQVPHPGIAVESPAGADLAADNRLLLSIDAELSDNGATFASGAGLHANAPREGRRTLTAATTD